MEFLSEVVGWFTDPANWSGPDGVPVRLAQHLALSAIPLAIAMVLALPVGAWVGHTGRGAAIVVNLANVGRAVPSLAVLVLVYQLVSRGLVAIGLRDLAGEIPTGVAMIALAIPPIVTNTYVGISTVDPELVEAGRGMGMRGGQILRRVELPVGLPVILAGVRTAAVQVVATATLGAVVGTGGLGRYIVDGIAQLRYQEMFAGAVLVAGLSIVTELFFARLQGRIVSPGLRSAPRLEPLREAAEVERVGLP